MKSIKITVAFALMLLLATGMIACKKSEEVVAPPVEQAAPVMEPAAPMAPAPEAAPEAAAPEAAAPEAAAPEAAPAAK